MLVDAVSVHRKGTESICSKIIGGEVYLGSGLLGIEAMPHRLLVRERGSSLTQERWRACFKNPIVSF